MYISYSRNICTTKGFAKAERYTQNGFCCGLLYHNLYGGCIPPHRSNDSFSEILKLTNVYLKMGIPSLAESPNARSFALAACADFWESSFLKT